MATYEDLTEQQKLLLDGHLNNRRAVAGKMLELFTSIEVLTEGAAAGPQALLDSIDAGATIPNKSGLVGSQDMTKAEHDVLGTLLTGYAALETTARRNVLIRAAGELRALGIGS